MLVKVRSTDGPNLTIPIPTGLFCNRLTAGIAAKAMAQNGMTITPEQLRKLFRCLRDCKRRFPDWVVTEVESADGDYVYVKL
ncbi:MAG: hypothetical protein IJE58_05910 [Oscillospiraceae bacterium]|nr:hypothetical protein [Oscillospiraceae bacterium]